MAVIQQIGLEKFQRTLSLAEREVFKKAATRSLNRTAMRVRTVTVRGVAKFMGVKQKPVRDRTKIHKANSDNLQATLEIRGRALNLIEFKARQVNKGVSSAPWGNRRIFESAFIVDIRGNRLVMIRRRAVGGRLMPRLPIRAMLGPGAASSAAEDELRGAREREMREFFPTEMRRQLDLLVSRLPS